MIRWRGPTSHERTLWGDASASLCRKWSVPAARGRRSAGPRVIVRGGGCRGRLCPVCGARRSGIVAGGGEGAAHVEPMPISWGRVLPLPSPSVSEVVIARRPRAAIGCEPRIIARGGGCLGRLCPVCGARRSWCRSWFCLYIVCLIVVARPFAGTGRPLSGTSLSAWGQTVHACIRVCSRVRARASF